jgi:hypothetical protein
MAQIEKLTEQVEQIIREAEGERCSVIVQMESPDERKRDQVVEKASEAIRKRLMTLTPRDVLPVPLDKLRGATTGKSSAASRRVLQRAGESLSAQVASIHLPPVSPDALNTLGSQALRPALDSAIVRRTPTPAPLWASKSLVVEMTPEELKALLSEVGQIRDIRPNRMLRIPPLVEIRNLPTAILENKASAWGIHATGALAAWGAYGARGKGVRIGLLDTGVDSSHADLQGKIDAWAEFDTDGKQVPNSTKPYDSHKHGTHCAGTLVGGNASGQWIGMAPEAKLAVALVLNGEQGGSDAQILAGIQWAIEQKVDVISMSLGGLTFDPETPPTYTEAILTALMSGIPVVTAIGNEGSQTSGSPGNDIFAFAVGATDHRDQVAGFSGGRTHIIRKSDFIRPELLPLPYSKPDVSAPGVAIKSCVPNKAWASLSGTSMATPHAAGAIALLLSVTTIRNKVGPNERAFVVQDLLTGTVEELGESGKNHRFGFGRIDILRAIGFAKERGY